MTTLRESLAMPAAWDKEWAFTGKAGWHLAEHVLFMLGVQVRGRGDWRWIARDFVRTRSPTQVASHAQKFFARLDRRESFTRCAGSRSGLQLRLDDVLASRDGEGDGGELWRSFVDFVSSPAYRSATDALREAGTWRLATRRASPAAPAPEARRAHWTQAEHVRFLAGYALLGAGTWRAIAERFVPTRTAEQVSTHAHNWSQHRAALERMHALASAAAAAEAAAGSAASAGHAATAADGAVRTSMRERLWASSVFDVSLESVLAAHGLADARALADRLEAEPDTFYPLPAEADSPSSGSVDGGARVLPWSRTEHVRFLVGMQLAGPSCWSAIHRTFLPSRSPAQIASHAQKFAARAAAAAEADAATAGSAGAACQARRRRGLLAVTLEEALREAGEPSADALWARLSRGEAASDGEPDPVAIARALSLDDIRAELRAPKRARRLSDDGTSGERDGASPPPKRRA